jgi:hypothetical protein
LFIFALDTVCWCLFIAIFYLGYCITYLQRSGTLWKLDGERNEKVQFTYGQRLLSDSQTISLFAGNIFTPEGNRLEFFSSGKIAISTTQFLQ